MYWWCAIPHLTDDGFLRSEDASKSSQSCKKKKYWFGGGHETAAAAEKKNALKKEQRMHKSCGFCVFFLECCCCCCLYTFRTARLLINGLDVTILMVATVKLKTFTQNMQLTSFVKLVPGSILRYQSCISFN